MRRWTDEEVWDAIDEWRWVPPGSTRIVTDDYELAITPGSYSLTYVYGFRVDGGERAEEKIREVRRRIEEGGGLGGRFQLTPRSRPPDLAGRLERHGYRPKEETEVLVWELRDERDDPRRPPFPPSSGVEIRAVETEPELDAFIDLAPPIFGDPPLTPETRRRFHEEFRRPRPEGPASGRYLAWADGVPGGRAGVDVAGRAARFWGTGVLEAYRRRGIYGALVAARCDAALHQGAAIALVTARVGSSGPILKKAGFRTIGAIRMYEANWSGAGSPGDGAETAPRSGPDSARRGRRSRPRGVGHRS